MARMPGPSFIMAKSLERNDEEIARKCRACGPCRRFIFFAFGLKKYYQCTLFIACRLDQAKLTFTPFAPGKVGIGTKVQVQALSSSQPEYWSADGENFHLGGTVVDNPKYKHSSFYLYSF